MCTRALAQLQQACVEPENTLRRLTSWGPWFSEVKAGAVKLSGGVAKESLADSVLFTRLFAFSPMVLVPVLVRSLRSARSIDRQNEMR